MSVSRIDDIYLYTGLTETGAAECAKIKNWLTTNNVKYTLLNYNDEAQFSEVFAALNSWWKDSNISDFPVVVYTLMDLDKSPGEWVREYKTSLDSLIAHETFLALSRKTS